MNPPKTILPRVAALVILFHLTIPIGAVKHKSAIKGKPIRVACIGNSITYGLGLSDRETESYPSQLQAMLGESYLVGNFGKSGTTLLRHGHRPYMEQTEFREALDFHADIAVIHLGINDTDPRNWPNYGNEFVGDYLALIDSLRKSSPEIRILVARMTPIGERHPRFQSGTKAWHSLIQNAIETVALVSGAELIDFHKPLYAHPKLLTDAVHPNAESARLLAKTTYEAITGDYGGLKVPMTYTDNMVLQRGVKLDIHGTANTGTQVSVSLGKQRVSDTANNRGEWHAVLDAMEATEGLTLTIEGGRQRLVFRNVAIGEVWICSGQSNMEFMLQNAATASEDIPRTSDNGLRFFDMKGRWQTNDTSWPLNVLDSVNHLQYFSQNIVWQTSTPMSASSFSAVAYYFGRMLRDSLQVPVGLICNAVGGSPAEAWIDRNTLEVKFPAILRDWLSNDFLQPWVRERAAKNIAIDTTRMARHPYEPCYLFESGIEPLSHHQLRGAIWYQGESNAHNMEAHERLFPLLVDSWRRYFCNDMMPFYFVQLSSLNRPSWPSFRDSQLRLMKSIPHTGMAVSSDLGDSLDVHPTHKREIGERLARWSLCYSYGKHIVASGPIYNKVRREGDALVVEFLFAEGLSTSDGKAPCCFEIAEHDGLFFPAEARIEDGKVWLSSSSVKNPCHVRYAWQPFTRANLINKDRIPASTFHASLEE